MSRDLPFHTLSSVSLTQLLRMAAAYGISPPYYPRFASLILPSVLSFPLRLVDRLRSSSAVRDVRIEQPPLFIVGHHRSGTTHLHNLLSRDHQFGCATAFHCAAADMFLGWPRIIRYCMERMLPSARPMDEVKVGLDEPQEEELAMARLSLLSFLHTYHFPRLMRDIFHRCVTFESGSPSDERRWKELYCWLLRRVTIEQRNKPLCLKSPPHMARIRQLLDLFPNARFVHIYRNPYIVYQSLMAHVKQVEPMLALQTWDWDEVEDNLIYFYQRMVGRFYADRSLIPDGQVAEVRFEDLEVDPLGQLGRIYGELRLDGFAAVRPSLEQYVRLLADYRKNRYAFTSDVIRRVEDQWGFAIDRWKYDGPDGR
jgi:omega-hydroxy-beta-dihydromenaquinone-9 sulfotransferase